MKSISEHRMPQNRRYFVIDTNALIQILGAHSKYRHIWNRFLDEQFVLCISNDILLEYEEMLKQKASAQVADMFIKVIAHSENIFKKDPFYRLGLIEKDADDNKFVDCAFACQAEYIVSDDTHFNILKDTGFPTIAVKKLEEVSEDLRNS